MENTLDELSGRLDTAEEKISKLEGIDKKETIKSETHFLKNQNK